MLTQIIQLLALFAAFQLGKTFERPQNKWPKGGLMQGGWKAMRPYLFGTVAVAALLNAFPLVTGGGGLGALGGGGYGGGGYGGGYGAY